MKGVKVILTAVLTAISKEWRGIQGNVEECKKLFA
jgi:hypothetical protein